MINFILITFKIQHYTMSSINKDFKIPFTGDFIYHNRVTTLAHFYEYENR